MIVYCGGCAASVLLSYLARRYLKEDSDRKLLVFFSALPLILIAALRYGVGEDYFYTYVPYFETLQKGLNADAFGMGYLYYLLNRIVILLGGSYDWVFAITAVVFLCCVFSQIFEDSPYPELSIFLLIGMGYYFVFFNAMRQMIGCGILFYALRFVRKKRFLPFLACVAISSAFHLSCLVFLPVYWIGRIKIPPKIAWIFTGLVIGLSGRIAPLLRNLIGFTRFAIYFQSVFDDGKTAYVMLAINAVLLVFDSVFYEDSPEYRLYYNLQMISVCVISYSGKIVLFLRMLWLFGLPSLVSLPIAVSKIENEKTRKILISVIILMYTLYFLYTVGLQNSNTVLPYRTIFNRWL